MSRSREFSFTALVLKKQLLGEADEIVTLFSKDQGKIRSVSKSSKLSTSKLQYSLQPLFLSEVSLAGRGNLPKLIHANTTKVFSKVLESQNKIAIWFVVVELVVRILPDELSNPDLFNETIEFLEFLDDTNVGKETAELGLLRYKIKALKAVGLGIHNIPRLEPGRQLMFSSSRGGFYYNTGRLDGEGTAVSENLWHDFENLNLSSLDSLKLFKKDVETSKLEKLVSQFVSYQLDREIKSEKYL